jgi:hypothetical protein
MAEAETQYTLLVKGHQLSVTFNMYFDNQIIVSLD